MSAVERWGEQLRTWEIPDEILAGAPESPWGFPAELFRRRAETAMSARDPTPSTRVALDALPPRGTVLDVGAGSGAASLPLAPRASLLIALDPSPAMLEGFEATALAAGIRARAVEGTWPEAASGLEPVDVVVCHHVLYNVQDLRPFVRALTDHARHRVVLEITDRHPLAWMSELWRRFHELERPKGPAADDAAQALRELGLDVHREDHQMEAGRGGFERRQDAIALVRRRLCLPPERDAEIAAALGDRLAERSGLWSAGPGRQTLVTLWWGVEP